MIAPPRIPLARRRFLQGMGALGAAGMGWMWHRNPDLRVFSRRSFALGAKVSMTALHHDKEVAAAAVEAAFAELELIESLMSLYRSESQISRLNRAGMLEDPHPYLVNVLAFASDVSLRSAGAFDITVQPLWRLFQEAHDAGGLPEPAAIRQTCQRVDWRRVRLLPGKVVLDGAGTQITLNGIAQGYAADAALRVMKNHGIAHALIDTGEFGASGQTADGRAWSIGIQHPRLRDALAAAAQLNDRCLATSGDYETTFTDDRLHHHVIDPRSGHSPLELSSVSVVAPTATTADALSTAVMVMGAERGLALVPEFPNAEALLILKDGSAVSTPGFPVMPNHELQGAPLSQGTWRGA